MGHVTVNRISRGSSIWMANCIRNLTLALRLILAPRALGMHGGLRFFSYNIVQGQKLYCGFFSSLNALFFLIFSRLFTTTISRYSKTTIHWSPECISPAKFTEFTVADVCFAEARRNIGRTSAATIQCPRRVSELNVTVLLSSKANKGREVRLLRKIEKLPSQNDENSDLVNRVLLGSALPFMLRGTQNHITLSPCISVLCSLLLVQEPILFHPFSETSSSSRFLLVFH